MKSFNLKVQMLDAGMTMFDSESGFGDTLGQVKAEMVKYSRRATWMEPNFRNLQETTTCSSIGLHHGESDIFHATWRAPENMS